MKTLLRHLTAAALLLAGVPSLHAAGCPAPSFATPVVTTEFGGTPSHGDWVIADFNGDGKPDLGYTTAPERDPNTGADIQNGRIAVLLSKGDGSFQPVRLFDAGSSPGALATGDFDGDGKQDLAAIVDRAWPLHSTSNSTVSVLFGLGDGGFNPATSFAVTANAGGLIAADFNQDGKHDLLASGPGRYIPATNTDPERWAGNEATLLLSTPEGALKQVRVLDGVPGGIVGDFNGDGKLDLVYGEPSFVEPIIVVLPGRGDGTFHLPVRSPSRLDDTGSSGARPVSVGDFNQDGIPDIAADAEPTMSDTKYALILLGRGDGTFRHLGTYPSGVLVTSLGAGDFNNDGNLDLVADSFGGTKIRLGAGDGTVGQAIDVPSGIGWAEDIAVADFNGDSRTDLAVIRTLLEETPGIPVRFYPALLVFLNTCVPPSHVIKAERLTDRLLLSWPLAAEGYVLESALSANSLSWLPIPQSPVMANGRWEVSTPFDSATRFFRLRKP